MKPPSIFFSPLLSALAVIADPIKLYIGELATGRHFYLIGDPDDGSAPGALNAYYRDMFRRCRDDYDGRVAWLDTLDIYEGFRGWVLRRMALLRHHRLCQRNAAATEHCIVPLGYARPAATLASISAALTASHWTTDPDNPAGASEQRPLLEGYANDPSAFPIAYWSTNADMSDSQRRFGVAALGGTAGVYPHMETDAALDRFFIMQV